MAEGIFQHIVNHKESPYRDLAQWKVDSCGTRTSPSAQVLRCTRSGPLTRTFFPPEGYHVGDDPDSRTMWTLQKHNVTDYEHLGRQVRDSDFDEFDFIFGMDTSNLSDLEARRARLEGRYSPGSTRRRAQPRTDEAATRATKAQVMLFGEFDEVPSKGADGKVVKGNGNTKHRIVHDPYYGRANGFEETFDKCKKFSKNFLEYHFPGVPFPDHIFTDAGSRA
jgi:low molecular weight phosphotyrosine protein phosphatase